ncbi:hypothetical protein [Candidatus Hodgkinia cicadicola]
MVSYMDNRLLCLESSLWTNEEVGSLMGWFEWGLVFDNGWELQLC